MTASEQKLLVLLVGVGVAAWLYSRSQSATSSDPNAPPPNDATSFFNNPGAAVSELITPWYQSGSAATWLPVLNGVESTLGIPTNLLARVAYEESRFREDIIRGLTDSTAGAMGMMQLEPQFFPVVNAPTPYTDQNVLDQINVAAADLVAQFETFGTWPLALAAYNAGAGAVKKYGNTVPPYKQTQDYVAQIMADVPAANA